LPDIALSVIIPTFNPQQSSLNTVLDALRGQTLPYDKWELIIVDNNSTNEVLNHVDISWQINAKQIIESRQGLTFSRVTGFTNATADIVVMVDDDNILASDYLELVLKHFNQHPKVGSIGGKIKGSFIGYEPAQWTQQVWEMLAIRDFGDQELISEPFLLNAYPPFAPVGAGMAVRKLLFMAYYKALSDTNEIITDRSGSLLSSGGDNEINIHVLKQQFSVAYFPDLILEHLIPQSRLTTSYLAELNYQSSKSWTRLLLKYDLCPWEKIPANTVLLRKIKAWITHKAWKGKVAYINWKGACGTFEELANHG
jgi:glycosyltransferase involved in cell wall biosynthesis